MTPACMSYVEKVLANNPKIEGSVLEIGSYNVNGSVRPLFSSKNRFPSYVGIDSREGLGVDTVGRLESIYRYQIERFQTIFDVIVSTEALEHDPAFWDTLKHSYSLLRLGGAIIITTRGIGFKRHDYPSDFWRFTADGLTVAFQNAGFNYPNGSSTTEEDLEDQGVFGVAFKL